MWLQVGGNGVRPGEGNCKDNRLNLKAKKMGSYLDVRERGESRKTLNIFKVGRAEYS